MPHPDDRHGYDFAIDGIDDSVWPDANGEEALEIPLEFLALEGVYTKGRDCFQYAFSVTRGNFSKLLLCPPPKNNAIHVLLELEFSFHLF